VTVQTRSRIDEISFMFREIGSAERAGVALIRRRP
jgi:hypothetical protein